MEDDFNKFLCNNKDKNNWNKSQDLDEILSIESQIEVDDSFEEDYLNIFLIILNDYSIFPNNKHIINIDNFIKFFENFYFKNNYLIIYYKYIGGEKIKLFGEKFVNNNKDNCYLIINEKYFELKSYINIKDIYSQFENFEPIKNIEVTFIQKKNKKIIDASNMFYNVSSLLSISNESSFDISNIKDMNHMFYNCSSLYNLSGISQWNITNVIDMSYMFYNCSSLKIFDNIYYWKLNNVKNKENMIYGCKDKNIYLYSFKIFLYYLSFLIAIIFIYYYLFYKKYFFIYFIMPFFLLSFSTIFIQAIIPYYFIYLSLCKYELEKYLDNTKIYNDFIKINNNIEFFKEKKYLRYINIYSSIFYTPVLIICLMADSKEYFIKKNL